MPLTRRPDFRTIYYDHDGRTHVVYPKNSAEDTEAGMSELLDHFVESGYATGGHLDTYVAGIGWVVEQ